MSPSLLEFMIGSGGIYVDKGSIVSEAFIPTNGTHLETFTIKVHNRVVETIASSWPKPRRGSAVDVSSLKKKPSFPPSRLFHSVASCQRIEGSSIRARF